MCFGVDSLNALLNILLSPGEKIYSKVNKVLSEFDSSIKNAVVVTDRGSNMVAAFRHENHINCVAHLINNIVEKGIEEVPKASSLIKACTKLVKYFKKSGANSKLKIKELHKNAMEHCVLFITVNRNKLVRNNINPIRKRGAWPNRKHKFYFTCSISKSIIAI